MTEVKHQLHKAVCCRCRQSLTHPLRGLFPDNHVSTASIEPFEKGLITTVLEFGNRTKLFDHACLLDFIVHLESMIGCEGDPSTFGCCGFSPEEKPNLICRCGSAVGWIWSDCQDLQRVIFDNRAVEIEAIASNDSW